MEFLTTKVFELSNLIGNGLLAKNPVIGMGSSFLTVLLTTNDTVKDIGTWLGILIGIITAIIKLVELRDKLKKKKKEGEEGSTEYKSPIKKANRGRKR